MTNTINRFFEATEDQGNILEKQHAIFPSMQDNVTHYYALNAMHYVSSQILDDEDLQDEYLEANDKVNKLSEFLLNIGLTEISSKEYKDIEKKLKETKQKPFLDNFSPEEKFVYNETKKYIEDYDFESSSQKSFLTSLRNLIVSDELITMYTIDEHAQKGKKDLDNIFDIGQQAMIAEFASDLQHRLKQQFKVKSKIKM